MKRTVPLIITATVGVLLIIANFIPALSAWGEDATTFFAIIAAIAFVLGGGSLLKVHLKKVSDRNQGWAFSLIVLGTFLLTLVIGLFKVGVPPNPAFPDNPWAGDVQGQGTAFWWVYEYVFKPLTATMFAMLAFYIASAAFRAFRAKNFEAILLLGALVFLGIFTQTVRLSLKHSVRLESSKGITTTSLKIMVAFIFETALLASYQLAWFSRRLAISSARRASRV